MAKAVVMWSLSHRFDPADTSNILLFISFRFIGAESYLGMLDATATVDASDTYVSVVTKIQNAVIARALDYGVVIDVFDMIPVISGTPDHLSTAGNTSGVSLSDNGADQFFRGNLGSLQISGSSAYPYLYFLTSGVLQTGFAGGGATQQFESSVFGTNDVFMRGYASSAAAYAVFEGYGSAGVIVCTNTAVPISIRPNRTEVAKFDANGLNMTAGAQVKNVVAQSGGKSVTNNVTVGGTADQGDDFMSLTLYATDAAAIRNNIYQLWQKVDRMADGLRTLGLLANS